MQFRSLTTRSMAGGAAILFAMAAALSAFGLMAARRALQEQAAQHATELTAFVAGQCERPLRTGKRYILEVLAEDVARREGVLYVVITNSADGSTVVRSHKRGTAIPAPGWGNPPPPREVKAGGETAFEVSQAVESEQDGAVESRGPRGVEPAGSVRVALSMTRQQRLFSGLVWSALGLSVLALAVALPLQWLSIWHALAPLNRLRAFAIRVGEGDVRGEARVERPDEAGDLAQGLNSVLERLDATVASCSYLDDVLQSMGQPLIVAGMDGSIEKVNQATLDLLGYEEAELLGKPATLVFERPLGVMGQGASSVGAYRAKSGAEVPVLFSSSVLRSAAGEPRGMIWAAQDITEMQRGQAELVGAKEAAEQANMAKSAFLATMSHELRTPLNAILGFTQLLEAELDGAAREQSQRDLKKIEVAGNHLLSLINDVLDVAKVDAGKMRLQIEPVELASVIDEVTAQMDPLAHKNGNHIEVRNKVALISGDAMRVKQCLLNLTGNACKFTSNGRITLDCVRVTDGMARWVDTRVSDTGIGISPEAMKRLFAEFTQVDGSATRKYGGTGLGLVICRKFCRLMGGDVLVESEPGKGSTFTMRLPDAGHTFDEAPASGLALAARD